MGAVVAILSEAGDPELAERLQQMLTRSPHRGKPEFLVEGPLAVGVQSLGSDASLAEHCNWIVAFHGYIGNWAELAAERGWRFEDGDTDADKAAVAYENLGDRLFAKLRGEWAMLIWNRREQALLGARDIAGCRPLFTHRHVDRLFLATEIRQVLAGSGAEPRCNPGAAADFLLLRFPEAGRTCFRGVDLFPGGVAREYRGAGSRTKTEDIAFWSPPAVDRTPRDESDLVAELRWLLERAVKRATPISGSAVSLSGGMDSSAVWGTLASLASPEDLRSGKFWPYSNVYPGLSCDETPYIRSIHSFTGVDGALIDTSTVLASEFMDRLCGRLDQPHLPNALPMELVCEAAAANGHSTVFTGVGGDEWLGGSLSYLRELFYSGRFATALEDLWTLRIPAREDGFRNRLALLSPGLGLVARLGLRRQTPSRMTGIIEPAHSQGSTPVRGSWRERVGGHGFGRSKIEMLICLDRLAAGALFSVVEGQGAWHGVEIRHPLMDVDIMNFGFSVQARALIAGRSYKWLLRRAMADRLPADVTDRIETTVFSDLFTREQGLLKKMPPGSEWNLVSFGAARADGIDQRLCEPYSYSDVYELISLWWLESFVARKFSSTGVAEPAEIG